jgi:short-subunit dehydrogenase
VSSRLTRLRGRRALVTGASSGIGRALALRLAAEGARVALVARRADALEALAAEVRAAGGEAVALPCDVAEREAVAAAAAHVVEAWGGVDLLVNNAGYGHHRRFLEWDLEDMERMLRVNTLGSLYWTKALLPGMVERGEGWIVFVASLAGRIAPPDESAYAASKFALVGVIRTPFFDGEALERMPAAARRQMVEPDGLVEAILGALRSGRRELTYPRMLSGAYAVRALFPRFFRWGVKRTAHRPDQTGSEGAE